MRLATAAFLCLLPAVAFAQQQPPSPIEQALSAKLGAEINSSLQCGASLVAAQAKIKDLEAQLKAATEPKDKPN